MADMHVKINGRRRHYRTVTFDHGRNEVSMIDQRLLPHRFRILKTKDYRETARAIRDMAVRGAGAIGAAAAYGFAQGLLDFKSSSRAAFEKRKRVVFELLKKARPTAVDPVNAMK
jgi:methylthioribose-1-phosphate isomerase